MAVLKSVLKALDPKTQVQLLPEPVLATPATARRVFQGDGVVFYMKYFGSHSPFPGFCRREHDRSEENLNELKIRCAQSLETLRQTNKRNKPLVALSISFQGLKVTTALREEIFIMEWKDYVLSEAMTDCERTLALMQRGTNCFVVSGFKTLRDTSYQAKTIQDQIRVFMTHLQEEMNRGNLAMERRIKEMNEERYVVLALDDNMMNEMRERKKRRKLRGRREETEVKSQEVPCSEEPDGACSAELEGACAAAQVQADQTMEELPPQPMDFNLIDLDMEVQPVPVPSVSVMSNLALLADLLQDNAMAGKGAHASEACGGPSLPPRCPVSLGAGSSDSGRTGKPVHKNAAATHAGTLENSPAAPHHGGARPKERSLKSKAATHTATSENPLTASHHGGARPKERSLKSKAATHTATSENPLAASHHGGARPKERTLKSKAAKPSQRQFTDASVEQPPRRSIRKRAVLEPEAELKQYFGGDSQLETIDKNSDTASLKSGGTELSDIYGDLAHLRGDQRLLDIEPEPTRVPRHSSPVPLLMPFLPNSPFDLVHEYALTTQTLLNPSGVGESEVVYSELSAVVNVSPPKAPPPVPPRNPPRAAVEEDAIYGNALPKSLGKDQVQDLMRELSAKPKSPGPSLPSRQS